MGDDRSKSGPSDRALHQELASSQTACSIPPQLYRLYLTAAHKTCALQVCLYVSRKVWMCKVLRHAVILWPEMRWPHLVGQAIKGQCG